MQSVEPGFREQVEALVAQIPNGRVMTYGQLAALCGNARAARIVGGIAHFGDPALPWQRVVNKTGGLAAGYPGGRQAHAEHLRAEGVAVDGEMHVDVGRLLWWPSGTVPESDAPEPGREEPPEQTRLV
ncbi:MAG TPA: MGMT family protein [Candidatus Saccharimonadales bacterium]|jgi:methylated-DNA-protein-cysteine methyltransferase-like protein